MLPVPNRPSTKSPQYRKWMQPVPNRPSTNLIVPPAKRPPPLGIGVSRNTAKQSILTIAGGTLIIVPPQAVPSVRLTVGAGAFESASPSEREARATSPRPFRDFGAPIYIRKLRSRRCCRTVARCSHPRPMANMPLAVRRPFGVGGRRSQRPVPPPQSVCVRRWSCSDATVPISSVPTVRNGGMRGSKTRGLVVPVLASAAAACPQGHSGT